MTIKITTFDDGFHRRIWFADWKGDGVQQYYPKCDLTHKGAIERIETERRDCARLVGELHAAKKICAADKRYDDARICGKLAKDYEGWVKAATWLLGFLGAGEWTHPKDWGHELWPQLDGLIAMAELAGEGNG